MPSLKLTFSREEDYQRAKQLLHHWADVTWKATGVKPTQAEVVLAALNQGPR